MNFFQLANLEKKMFWNKKKFFLFFNSSNWEKNRGENWGKQDSLLGKWARYYINFDEIMKTFFFYLWSLHCFWNRWLKSIFDQWSNFYFDWSKSFDCYIICDYYDLQFVTVRIYFHALIISIRIFLWGSPRNLKEGKSQIVLDSRDINSWQFTL